MKEFKSQAVVIIHGIGEQQPMDTLRGFVKSVKKYLELHDESERTTKIRSHPDHVSENFEMRLMSLSASRRRPKTDFYEFYWAHNMRDTTFAHISKWLWRIILTPQKRVPPRLRILWRTFWGLVILVLCTCLALFYFGRFNNVLVGLAAILSIPTLVTLISLIEKFFGNLFLSTAGDAARYFSPTPSNIAERHNIRRQGINLLQGLHETINDRSYERIIVVGHSLGSAIGYDLLRTLWTMTHKTYKQNPTVNQELIKEMDHQCNNLDQLEIGEFQNAQYRLWEQQRETGNTWRITDFVTLGAAVTSLDYFLIGSEPFPELVRQREFPVCPSVVDEDTKSICHHLQRTYKVDGKLRTVKLLHHAALFAVTRWTNIFFTSDYVGSEASRIFGKGIKDVAIPRRSVWFLPGGHTRYWDDHLDDSALAQIVGALRLRHDSNPVTA